MPRQRLSRMSTFTGTPLMAAVAISWLFIWNDPSPAMHTTWASGRPMAAPMAAGKPKPMVPRPPLERKVRGRVAVDELGSPHLMLAHLGHHHGALGVELGRQLLQHLLGHDLARLLGLAQARMVEREALPPAAHQSQPLLGVRLGARLLQRGVEPGEHALEIAYDGHLHLADLADLGRIDVYVDDPGVRGELGELAGHAVGEAGAGGDDEVAFGQAPGSSTSRRACPPAPGTGGVPPGSRPCP